MVDEIDGVVSQVWALVVASGPGRLLLDEGAAAGQVLADRLTSALLPVELAFEDDLGDAALDLIHIGPDAEVLTRLDRLWPRLSPTGMVVVERLEDPEVLAALWAYAQIGRLAVWRSGSADLGLLTLDAAADEALRRLGWRVVTREWWSPPTPERNSRLLFRAQPRPPARAQIHGETESAVEAARAQYEALDQPGHIHRVAVFDVPVFDDLTVVTRHGVIRESRRLISREQSEATIGRFEDRALPKVGAVLFAPSNANFYHWMVEALFSCWLLRRRLPAEPLPALSASLTPLQRETLGLIGWPIDRVRQLAPGEGVRADPLVTLTPLTGHLSARASPLLLEMFDDLRAALGVGRGGKGRRFYVSRKDTPARPLENEDELIAALERRGFEIVTLSALSLAEQAKMFTEAALVVAPHGAGLTNLGYCDAAAKVVELMPEHYFNACFITIGELIGLEHHVHVGRSTGASDLRHRKSWRIDLEQVLALVDALDPKSRA